jgi:hypothetical protein
MVFQQEKRHTIRASNCAAHRMFPAVPVGGLYIIRMQACPVEMAMKGQGKARDARRHQQQHRRTPRLDQRHRRAAWRGRNQPRAPADGPWNRGSIGFKNTAVTWPANETRASIATRSTNLAERSKPQWQVMDVMPTFCAMLGAWHLHQSILPPQTWKWLSHLSLWRRHRRRMVLLVRCWHFGGCYRFR